MSRRPAASRTRCAALGALLTAVVVLTCAAPADAAPTPGPGSLPAAHATSDLPTSDLPTSDLPTLSLPTIVVPPVAPVLGGVVSTVNGLGTSVRNTVNGVLAPVTPAPTRSAPASSPTHPSRATTRPVAARPATPGSTHHASPVRRATPTHRTSTPGVTGPEALGPRAFRTGTGPARSGLLASPSGISTNPVTLVRQATLAVMHPGRALLTIVAITALCALGMLGLVFGLGRRGGRDRRTVQLGTVR